MKTLCTSELLTVFVLGGSVTRHVGIYLCVLVFCTLDGYHQRQEHLGRGIFRFLLCLY